MVVSEKRKSVEGQLNGRNWEKANGSLLQSSSKFALEWVHEAKTGVLAGDSLKFLVVATAKKRLNGHDENACMASYGGGGRSPRG